MRVLTGRGGGGSGGRRGGGAGGNYSGGGSWEPNPEVWDIESESSSSSPSDEEMREDVVKYLWPGRVENISAARVPIFGGRGSRHHSSTSRGSSPDDRAVDFSPVRPNQPGQMARGIDLDQTDRGVEQNRREVNRLAERKSKLSSLLDLKLSSPSLLSHREIGHLNRSNRLLTNTVPFQ